MNKISTHRKDIVIICSILVITIIFIQLIGCSGNNVVAREGSVTGKITTVSGGALEGALVRWANDSRRYSYTDENGIYIVNDVSFGTQQFIVTREGYKQTSFSTPIYSGQTTTAADVSVTTQSFYFSDIKVTETSSSHAIITWKTSDYTYGMIEYGTTESFGSAVKETDVVYSTTHSVKISNLKPETSYFFRIVSSRQNQNAEYSDIGSFATISVLQDNTPPTSPGEVSVALSGVAGKAVVYWQQIYDSDLKGYKVYRSESYNGIYSSLPIGQTIPLLLAKGVNNFTDDTVVPGKKYYYRVTAVDQAGNESGYNGNSEGIVVPGRITSDVRWTVANSPYIIKGDLTVSEFGSLTIDDGVKVLVSDVDATHSGEDNQKIELRVSGKLITSQGPSKVIFAANMPNPSNNVWKGIIFDNMSNTDTNLINATISDAEKGITIKSTQSGTYKDLEIINCAIGAYLDSSVNLEIDNFKFKRCPTAVNLANCNDITVSNSNFIEQQYGIISDGSNGLSVKGNNFLNYNTTAIKSNDVSGSVSFTNNLFVSPTAKAIEISNYVSLIEYNTFDTPYAISIANGAPTIRKNIILANSSVFGMGMIGIENKNAYTTPTFGPNNIYGFGENAYSGCNASADSASTNVVLMKSVNAEPYDYRLRVDYPSTDDCWGIKRDYIVSY